MNKAERLVVLKDGTGGKTKKIKVGWSWTLFLFSGFWGIPLIMRKLYFWACVFIALWVAQVCANFLKLSPIDGVVVFGTLTFVIFGLAIYLGIKGNELTARKYLTRGWKFADKDSESAKHAMGKWGVTDDASLGAAK